MKMFFFARTVPELLTCV